MAYADNSLWRRLVSCILAFAVALWAVFLSPQRVGADDFGGDIYECLSKGFYDFADSIDISDYGLYPEELADAFASVIKDDPYLFFVSAHLSYTRKSEGCVLSVRPSYTMTEAEAAEATDYCRSEVKRIAETCTGLYGELERALYLHDYLCANYAYDESHESAELYSFLLGGSGTCQGYAYAYTALLREVGISVTFAASDTISHIWNLVCIDGEWYHADITWDDTADGISHRHFLLSDTAAAARGKRDWYSPHNYLCLSDRFVAFDFSLISHGAYGSGDIDHSGGVDLCDIVGMRETLERGQSEKIAFCIFCADIDGDGVCDGDDLELLRRKILTRD